MKIAVAGTGYVGLVASVCFAFTEWGEIKEIKPKRFKELMKTPLVYDGRNMFDLKEMKNAGVEYHSIGRKSINSKIL